MRLCAAVSRNVEGEDMTTDLKSMTVEELTPEQMLSEIAEYFDQDFRKDEGNWQFLPSHCHIVAAKVRDVARRIEEAQQKIAEAKAEALEEWQVLYRKAFDPEQTLAIHALNNAGAKAAEYRANSGRKE